MMSSANFFRYSTIRTFFIIRISLINLINLINLIKLIYLIIGRLSHNIAKTAGGVARGLFNWLSSGLLGFVFFGGVFFSFIIRRFFFGRFFFCGFVCCCLIRFFLGFI